MSTSNGPALARSNHVRQRSQPSQGPSSTNITKQVSAPALEREPSQSSDSSASSHRTARSSARPSPSPYSQRNNPPAAASTASLTSNARPPRQVSYDLPPRVHSPVGGPSDFQRHRARQHSQGFFEPSLPTASYAPSPPVSLTASQIAAQAAMQVQGNPHVRRRSQTVPDALAPGPPVTKRNPSYSSSGRSSNSPNRAASRTPSALQAPFHPTAATAASAAYPTKSTGPSPILQQQQFDRVVPQSGSDRDQKPGKEKSRMKIFSKPKSINVSATKDIDKKAFPSPKKLGAFSNATFPRALNLSSTSLVDPSISSTSSIYSNPNASTSTLVPTDSSRITGEKEKRHHFLSRQKNKLKDTSEQHNLSLSSAASNSKPTDPNTQPLYSFVPSSPAPTATFNKSKTGLDLRHGGRAFREKKREEKAAAGTFVGPHTPNVATTPTEAVFRDREGPNIATPERPGTVTSFFGPASNGSVVVPDNAALQSGLGVFGLPGMTLDDAWPLLKARLLNVFEGEDIRTPIEDFNRLVVAHIQRCVQQQNPTGVVRDVRDLVNTGFQSLDHTLRRVPDHRLVPHLVKMWGNVLGTIVPFIQAAFHPLDLEMKGRGTLFSPKDVNELWSTLHHIYNPPTREGAGQNTPSLSHTKSSSVTTALRESLDVRTLTLTAFRDNVILPRHDTLLSIFSRLSLDNINAVPMDRLESPPPLRPGTATSASSSGPHDFPSASFNSQGSTLLDSSTAGSLGARSRATSNTSAMSAGSFHSIASSRPHASSHGSSTDGARNQAQQQAQAAAAGALPPGPVLDSTQVTQTAARMLQCISVLAGLQSPSLYASRAAAESEAIDGTEDEETLARKKMQRLCKELKLNWLGRGRTGRNRKGFVGGKIKLPTVGVAA